MGESSFTGEDSRVGGPGLDRRAEDRLDMRGAARMLEVVAGRPTPDRLAQELALGTLSRFKPKVVLISYLSPGAKLKLAGSFGLGESVAQDLGSQSIWERSPMAEAVRLGGPVEVASHGMASDNSWEQRIGPEVTTFIAIPLGTKDQKLGALGLGFDGGFEGLNPQKDLSGVAAVLSIYLGLQFEGSVPSGVFGNGVGLESKATRADASGAEEPVDPSEMSDRRRQVLRLMADGMTNSQIAYRIGFSESTVRHETMAIYRMLGATDRRDAARIAEAIGLLSEDNTDN